MDFTPKWLMQDIRGSGACGHIPHVTRDLPDTPPVDVFV